MRTLVAFTIAVAVAAPVAASPAQGAGAVTVRRLTAADTSGGFIVEILGPSPDGRSVTTLLPMTGDLGVRDLVTGQVRELTKSPVPYAQGMVLDSRVSPDGRWVAYTWFSDRDRQSEIRVMEMTGSAPRSLFSSRTDWAVPTDWSRDGSQVAAVVTRPDGTGQLVSIPASGAPHRVIRTLDKRRIRAAQFSPDGQFIVYDRTATLTSPQRRVYIAEVSTGTERELLVGPASDEVMGWSPDGRQLVILRTGDGAPAAWSVPVANGRVTGQPVLLRGDLWRAAPLTATTAGRFYYVVETGGKGVYLADLDPTSGAVRGTPTRLNRNGVGRDARIDWSRDGRFIAHSVRHHPGAPMTMVITSVESGQTREFPLPPNLSTLQDHRWMPNGGALLIRTGLAGSDGFLRMDVQTGKTDVLPLPAGTAAVSFDVFPDGRRLIYRQQSARSDAAGNSHVVIREIASGVERVLFSTTEEAGNRTRWSALSLDGSQFAFVRAGAQPKTYELVVVPTGGGGPRVIARGNESSILWSMAWAPDGRSVFVVRFGAPGDTRGIWRIPVDGSAPTRLSIDLPGVTQPRFDPSGRRLAFAAGVGAQELWVLEGLPMSSPAGRR